MRTKNIFSAIGVLLFLLPAFLLPAQETAQELSYTFEKEYEKSLKTSLYVYSIDLPGNITRNVRKLKEQKISLEMVVSGENKQVLAGAKIKIFSSDKGGTKLINFFWKKKLSQEKTLIRSQAQGNVKNSGRILFLIYNCDRKKGAVYVHKIKLTISGRSLTQAELKKGRTLKKIDPKGKVPLTPLSVKRDFFPAGVYFYLSKDSLGKTKAQQEEKFRQCMKDIAAHSCNAVYLSGISNHPELFNSFCKIASEYNINVFAQGNGLLYLQTSYGPDYFEDRTLPAMRKSLPLLKGKNLTGFSCKEEVDFNDAAVKLMQRARKEQKNLMKNVPSYTLHNTLTAMAMDDDPENQPDWYAFDMYRFKLHPSRNVIMTPSKAARRIRTNLEIAYLHAAKFGKPLIFVGQGVKVYTTIKNRKITRASGMKEVSPGVWEGYARYMPKNAMYLQFYLAVMSGCRGFMAYHYMAEGKEQTLVDKNLKETFYWKEMGDCLKENRKLFPLFASWYKQPLRAELKTSSKTVPVREFKHPDFRGRFILPVNTLIAKWDKYNPMLTTEKTRLYSDKENLQGFEWAKAQSFALSGTGKEVLYDLLTGEKTDPGKITLPPGKGRIYYQGSRAELEKIRKKYLLQ